MSSSVMKQFFHYGWLFVETGMNVSFRVSVFFLYEDPKKGLLFKQSLSLCKYSANINRLPPLLRGERRNIGWI